MIVGTITDIIFRSVKRSREDSEDDQESENEVMYVFLSLMKYVESDLRFCLVPLRRPNP
jgi:hypothetical protein